MVFVLLITVILFSSPVNVAAGSCALYNPPTPGLTCFHGNELERAVTSSKTVWLVEFYSSWCGHCQHFAPAMREIGAELDAWSSVFRLGMLECTGSKVNQEACEKFKVQAYPTLMFFGARDKEPLKNSRTIVGSRSKKTVLELIVDHIGLFSVLPALKPLTGVDVTLVSQSEWTPLVLVFEEASSYTGRMLILDFVSHEVDVRRVLGNNTGLLRFYSVLELPSVVIELTKGDYHVISGKSFDNPRAEFKSAILGYLQLMKTSERVYPSPASLERAIASPVNPDSGTTLRATRINRVHRSDLLSTISYALRSEVPIHSIVSGSAFSSLLRFIILLERALSAPYPAVSRSLQAVRVKVEAKTAAGFITRSDWNRIIDTKLDTKLFPVTPRWINCAGSHSHFRGYPCGLWMLMHTLTVLTLPLHTTHTLTQAPPPSKETLRILTSFIRDFFSCEHCRSHFMEMTESLNQESKVHHDGDAILWLWEAHNSVNKRLINALSSDPLYPKSLFPAAKTCPYCYLPSEVLEQTAPSFNNSGFLDGGSLLSTTNKQSYTYVWNKTSVLLYLWNFYHLTPPTHKQGESPHYKPANIIAAAWPKKFKNTEHLHHKYYGLGHQRLGHTDVGFTSIDKGICLTSYFMCFLFLGFLGYWLYRRKRYRKFLQYP